MNHDEFRTAITTGSVKRKAYAFYQFSGLYFYSTPNWRDKGMFRTLKELWNKYYSIFGEEE